MGAYIYIWVCICLAQVLLRLKTLFVSRCMYLYIYGCIHIYVCICLAQVILWFKALFGSRSVYIYIYIKSVSNHWSSSSQTKMHVAQVLLLAQGIAFFSTMHVCVHSYIYECVWLKSLCGSRHCACFLVLSMCMSFFDIEDTIIDDHLSDHRLSLNRHRRRQNDPDDRRISSCPYEISSYVGQRHKFCHRF